MASKADVFNLALGALLLSRRITATDSDTSNEAKVLNTHWDTAWRSALADLDLDSTATIANATLVVATPNNLWGYAYLYPANCAYFRRFQSCVRTDTRFTHVNKRTGMLGTQKVIFTDQEQAVMEYIATDFNIQTLAANAVTAVAYRLAILSSPLIVGKGARGLRESINGMYQQARAEAQAQDRRENFVFQPESELSDWVAERMS